MEIPKDIRKYEAKLIGPLTTRQAICLVPAVALAVLAYTTLDNFLSQDVCLFIVIIIVAPFLLCGWFKPYNMPFEKFLQTVFVSVVLAPVNRKYVTKNVYEEIAKEREMLSNKKATRSKTKSSKKSTQNTSPELVAYK